MGLTYLLKQKDFHLAHKTKLNYMLYTRDNTSKIKRFRKSKCKGMNKSIPGKRRQKEPWNIKTKPHINSWLKGEIQAESISF